MRIFTKEAIELAEQYFDGDLRAVEMLEAHLAYTGGSYEPENESNGVKFFVVGHNSTHEFSMGMLDGRCYRRAVGEGYPEPYITEHGEWGECSYWGHH